MVIECSSCHARFKLADDKIKENGTKVRCTKCREVFTVFPEISAPLAPPVMTVAPAAIPKKEVVSDTLFEGTDTAFAAEIPTPAVDIPASEGDDWNQAAASNFFSDEFAVDASSSDLDAISFDNIEAPVFSIAEGKNNKFEFTDDTAFSFPDSSLESGAVRPYEIAETTDGQSLATESHNDFEADYSPTAPSIPSTEDLNQFSPVVTDDEFTFSGSDNLADLTWDEPETTTPIAATAPEPAKDTGESQDAAFDFSSFSFDDVAPASESADKKHDEIVARNDTTVELSSVNETESSPPELTRIATETPAAPFTGSRQETAPRSGRPLRPRLRPKKKGSSRKAAKVIIFILLSLAAVYGIVNRAQIETVYNNIVNSFIEKQTRVEINGRIGLVNLSGSYVQNRQEGNLFVIRGEAVNDFKDLRSSVLVRGTIYGDNGTVLQSQSAYCGNPLKDSSLKNSTFKQIREAMNNELGENLVNLNIATGKRVPFTIVFNKIPNNIKEFTVEVLESKPGSK